jgi:hypothetical protein
MAMLAPYMLNTAVPANNTASSIADKSWAAPMAMHCALTHTHWMRSLTTLTPQEQVLKTAVEDTLRQICRVLSEMWIEAFAIEADIKDEKVDKIEGTMAGWKTEVKDLMAWLDWNVWVKCRPECGPEEWCYIPTWPAIGWGGRQVDMTPKCVSKFESQVGFPG